MNRRALITASVAASMALTRLPVGAQVLQKLRVVGTPVDSTKVIYYAIKANIFRKYGIEVEPTIANSGAAGAAALVGGAVDVAGISALTVFQMHLRGVPVKYVAPSILLSADRPTTATVVAKNSPIKTGKDLNGKIVGSSSVADMNSAATLAWIEANGGDPKSVKLIEIPASAAAAALDSGRADAITLNEPAVGQVVAAGSGRVLSHPYEAVAKVLDASGWAMMQPAIDKNQDLVIRFERAVHEAALYTNNHNAETVDIVASYANIPADVVAKSARMFDPEYLEVGYFQPLIDSLAHYGFLSAAFNANDIIAATALKPSH